MREMKDSGIPWIGEIPKEWQVCFIKQIMRNKSIKGYPDEQVLSLYRDYGVVPKDSRSDNHNVTSEDTSSYKFVEVGDFVINKMKAWQGSMAVSGYQGIISPAYYICRFTNNQVERRYIHYLLRNDSYKTEYMRLSSGLRVGQWDLNIDDFLRIQMILPSLAEQQRIAEFLDRKCAEVDEMIGLQEQIIEELKAYKQSVITEAVTKGLNPDTPMRDSGIEWIGQIPEHWRVMQFRRLFEIKKTIANALGYDVLSVTQGGLKVKDLSANEGQIAQDYSKYQIVGKDDYVMNHMDLLTGFVDCSTQIGVTSPDYRVFQSICKADISLSYFLRIFQTCYKLKIFYHLGQGVSGMGRWRLPTEQLKLFYLPVPPLIEQLDIADYLDEKCADIDSLIQTKLSKIDSLKEYKKSIIYEYVTGKREVTE